jgi:uncharacterized membrane protein YphA (DoxX/SURF4 family)
MATGKAKTVALWVLSVLLAALFVMAGGSKLAGGEQVVANFARWGYPPWFRFVLGTGEVVSALLLLWPRTAFLGAGGAMVVMLGASYTHVFIATGEAPMAIGTMVIFALAGIVGWARRPRFLRRVAGAATAQGA